MKKILLIVLVLAGLMAQAQQKGEKETVVVIKTNYGTIKAKLYNDTPLHRDNFVKLVNQGWYDGSPFHRVIKNFMIQGGGKTDGTQDPGYTVPAEIKSNHIHKRGALCAARKPDQINPKKASSGSQFYIMKGQVFDDKVLDMYEERLGNVFSAKQRQTYTTVGGTPHLDGEYTVFGEVIVGLDVVEKISKVQTGFDPVTHQPDCPVEPVTMTITIEK